jgi:YfiH family protein
VEVVFTDRHGGVSTSPYSSLNLSLGGGDDPEAVRENLHRVELAFNDGVAVASMHQVHGADVAVVGGAGAPPTADGLVTVQSGVALMVRVADCVPVLLADPDSGVVGAAHSGRLGLVRGVVPATIDAMRAQGACSLVAWIGPHICGLCYEVPAELRDDVCAEVPEAWAETSWGTPAVDIGAGVIAQLSAAGVEVVDARRCTREEPDLYSYRRDGDGAGRFAGLIRVKR